MTRLWTEAAPAVDTELNERLEGLAGALARYFGREVVFHDAGGAFAPVISDAERIHIHLHGCPRPARPGRNAPEAPRQVGDFPGDVVSGHPLPRINASSSREVQNINCRIRGARNQRLAQVVENTYFFLLRPCEREPAAAPRPISATVAEDMILHAIMSQLCEDDRRAPMMRPSMMARHQRDRWLADFPDMEPLFDLGRRTAVRASIEATLLRTTGDPLSQIRRERDNAATQERNAERELNEAGTQLQERRRERLAQNNHDPDSALRETFREELRQIRALPQTISAEIAANGRLAVWLKPMLMAGGQRGQAHDPDQAAVVGPIHLTLTPGTSNARAIASITDAFGVEIPHPHVRHSPCLGSISEPLRSAMSAGNLSVAVQLMIGFLQTYNVDDAWGRIGASWPRWNVGRGPGNTANLSLPAPQEPAPSAADTAEAA